MGHGQLAGDTESGETRHAGGLGGAIQGFRERLIRLDTMSWPLRLAVAATVALVVLLAASIALRNVIPQPLLDDTFESNASQVPLATAVVTLASVALAWSFFMAGALHAHWLMRLLGIVIFLGVLCISSLAFAYGASPTQPLALVQFGLLAVVLLRAAFLSFGEIRVGRSEAQRRRSGRSQALSFALTLVVVAAYFALDNLYESSVLHQSANMLAGIVNIHLVTLLYPVTVVVFLAGTDLAETAQSASERVASLAGRFGSRWLLPLLTAGVAVGVGAHIVVGRLAGGTSGARHLIEDALAVGLGGVAFGLVLIAVRLGRLRSDRMPRVMPVAALAVAAVVFVGGLWVRLQVVDWFAPPPSHAVTFSVYRHASPDPVFSIAYPQGWDTDVIHDGTSGVPTAVQFTDVHDTQAGLFVVLQVPLAAGSADLGSTDALLQWFFGDLTHDGVPDYTFTPAPADGPWDVRHVTFQNGSNGDVALAGTAWIQRQGDAYWILYGLTDDSVTQLSPAFVQIAHSWRPDLSAVAPQTPPDAHARFVTADGALSSFGFPIALALVLGLPLLALGRRRSPAIGIAGLFLLVVGLVNAFVYLPDVLALVGVTSAYVPKLSIGAMQLFVALLTLLLLPRLALGKQSAPAATRKLLLLLCLNLALEGIVLYLAIVTSSGGHASAPTHWTALLLVGAFLWDLLTSGEQVTNRDSRAFPRQARVLLYLGYTLVSATYVAYYSVETFVGDGKPVGFASDLDTLTQYGLLALGVPLLVTLAIAGWVRLSAEGAEETAPPVERAAVVQEARAPYEVGVR